MGYKKNSWYVMSKIIFSGLESSGKSLQLAMQMEKVVKRNAKWFQRTGQVRPIYSNMIFEPHFKKAAEDLGVPLLEWENLDDLIKISNADVFIDEVGNYFDSRSWPDLSLDVRRWITQGAKAGVEIYGAAQDFAQVDLAFRRLVNELWHVNKMIGSRRPSPTKPPVKRIWGLCSMRELNPRGYKEDKKEFENDSFFPRFFFIRRYYCEIFDTLQFIKRSKPATMKHSERFCEDEVCGFKKVIHA